MPTGTFKIIPILGIRNDLPADDNRLLTPIGQGVAYCNCVEGENFDLVRKRGVCSKSYGYEQWSHTATAQHTKTLGMFELYDGTNRNWVIGDNGKIYYYDGSEDPIDISGAVTLSTANLYSIVKVGAHAVIAEGATTPYSWKHGDVAIAKAISGGTEYKFKYLVYFMQRLIGLYSDQTDGDIDIRWSGAIPVPATTCVFTGNQMYVPNDDSITGVGLMGENSCYIYCDNSIQQLTYNSSYATPFSIYTVVSGQGFHSHHSIIAFPDRHYGFNRNYGFCEYHGGNTFPFGEPISQAIESEIAGIDLSYANLIVGKFIPRRRQLIWLVPANSNTTPNKFFIYDLSTKQWSVENISARYIDVWRLNVWSTIGDLETAFGLDVEDLDPDNKTFAYYDKGYDHVVFSNIDGHTYLHETDTYNGSNYTGYRIEPVLDFGNSRRSDLLTEIWFDLVSSSNHIITIYWRGGNTLGEIMSSAWQSVGTISHLSPNQPFIPLSKDARLHQIKWEVVNQNERFQINGITFKFTTGSER